MPALSRTIVTWLVFGVLGALAVLVAGVGYTAVALPGCESCHLEGDFGSETAAAPHADVACVDCHVEDTAVGRVSFATRELFHMVIPIVKDLDRTFSAVPAERCVSCHAQVEQPGTVGTHGLKIAHITCVGTAVCSDCHSITAHGASTAWPRVPQMEECYECHGTTNDVTDCDTCHVERDERQRVFDGPFRVTHGPQWESTHGMGDMKSCSACHDDDKCAGCHGAGVPHGGAFVDRHAEFSTSPEARCVTCHLTEFCEGCHSYEMPHPVEFVTGHGDVVEADGQEGCLSCHEEADCTECHVSHVHPVTQEQMDSFLLGGSEGEDDR